jgi:hypothetical protein
MRIQAHQMASLARAQFFERVAAFIREQSTHEAFRAAALDAGLRESLWKPHWERLSKEPEAAAALFLCFVLGCTALGADPKRGAALALQAREPALSMKSFLANNGLLRFSAFDVPDLTRPGAQA